MYRQSLYKQIYREIFVKVYLPLHSIVADILKALYSLIIVNKMFNDT